MLRISYKGVQIFKSSVSCSSLPRNVTTAPSSPVATATPSKASQVPAKPRQYWKEKENQREFLEGLRSQLGLPSVQDWKSVPAKTVVSHGGSSLLRQYPSFHNALQSIYPEENWAMPETPVNDAEWSPEKIRSFLTSLAEELGLHSEADWARVSARTIKDHGGVSLMRTRPSLFDILSDAFPERDWWKSGLQMKIPRRFWDQPENQHKFMVKLGKKLGVHSPEEWLRVSPRQIEAHGGRRLLELHRTMYDLLSSVFPENDWSQASKDELPTTTLPRTPRPSTVRNLVSKAVNSDPHGLNMKSFAAADTLASDSVPEKQEMTRLIAPVLAPHRIEQRRWMDELGNLLGIKHHNEWIPYTMDIVLEHGGTNIAEEYPTLSAALRKLYPEFKWRSLPQGNQKPHSAWSHYWKSRENQLEYLKRLEKRLGIRHPLDWVYITPSQVKDHGGYGFLFYYSTMHNALRELYPEVDWSVLGSQSPQWRSVKHQRAFLDQVADSLQIRSPEDWRSVTVAQIRALGGSPLLACYPSFFDALRTIYPEQNWLVTDARSHAPRNYWTKRANQREFLDSIAFKFSLQEPRDWTRITAKTLKQQGGLPLLRQYPSFYSMLRSVYPEKDWDFFHDLKTLPDYYWSDPANVKSFADYVARRNNIQSKEDWFELPESAIADVFGGRTLLKSYGSLFNILQIAYPDESWDSDLFQPFRLTEVSNLFRQLGRIFPDYEILEGYVHDGIKSVTGKQKFKSTAYIPDLKLAVKYHTKTDYRRLGPASSLEHYYRHDRSLIESCAEQGIRLLVIPYWHDWTEESLRQLILSVYPQLQSIIQASTPESSRVGNKE